MERGWLGLGETREGWWNEWSPQFGPVWFFYFVVSCSTVNYEQTASGDAGKLSVSWRWLWEMSDVQNALAECDPSPWRQLNDKSQVYCLHPLLLRTNIIQRKKKKARKVTRIHVATARLGCHVDLNTEIYETMISMQRKASGPISFARKFVQGMTENAYNRHGRDGRQRKPPELIFLQVPPDNKHSLAFCIYRHLLYSTISLKTLERSAVLG